MERLGPNLLPHPEQRGKSLPRQIAYHRRLSRAWSQEPPADLNQIANRGVQPSVQNILAVDSDSMRVASVANGDAAGLVERAQQGDREAFEQIYRQQVGRVHALCWRLTGDADLAEELTQEAFVRAWRKLKLFSGRSALSTWLHRLTVNVVMADHRVHGDRRRRQLPLDDDHLEQAIDRRQATEIGLDLERAIATLPPRARSVFVLHDVEGYGHAEIADIAGMAVGTSKAHLHRARQLLRKAILK